MISKRKCPGCEHLNSITALSCTECYEALGASTLVEVESHSAQVAKGHTEVDQLTAENDEFQCAEPSGPAPYVAQSEEIEAHIELVFGTGRKVSLNSGQVIGRNSIAVNSGVLAETARHPGISRAHAWVGLVDRKLMLIDLGSTNGTFVGDERVPVLEARNLEMHDLPIIIGLGKCFKFTVTRQS